MGFVSVRESANSVAPYLLVGLFLTSGFYDLPFAHFDVSWVLRVKNLFYLIFMCVMLLGVNWRAVHLDVFAVGCLIWAGTCVVSWFVSSGVSGELYLKRVVQISFAWTMVTYVRQHRDVMSGVMKFFSPYYALVGCFVLIFLSFNTEVAAQIRSGFGNNRVNFSIWLSQLVFLCFLGGALNSADSKIKVSYFIYVLPILGFQMFLGSRTGLIASVSIYLIALLFLKRHKVEVLVLLAGALLLAWGFSPLRVDPAMDMTRALNMDVKDTHAWVDRFSSYRVSIAETAIATLAPVDFLFGKGMGNFQGYAIGQTWDVHNIYLKAFGELGLGGAFGLFLIVVWPLRKCTLSTTPMRLALFFFLLEVGVGLGHPEFLVTALSTCLVFWMMYAYLLESEQSNTTVASAGSQ